MQNQPEAGRKTKKRTRGLPQNQPFCGRFSGFSCL